MVMQSAKSGITKFGFIENIKTFIDELNSITKYSSNKADYIEFNNAFDNAVINDDIKYLDKFGNPINESDSYYAVFKTDYIDKNDANIIAYFRRYKPSKNWTGIFFTNEQELKIEIERSLLFKIGKLIFDKWGEGLQFLEELKQKAIPEKWSYRTHKSKIPHPILKSFLENTFEKLLKDKTQDKLIISESNKYAIFNSGLLDKFFHDIYVVLEVRKEDNEFTYWNPFTTSGLSDIAKLKIMKNGELINHKDKFPKKIDFFSNISEVTFNDSIPIDTEDYVKFTHIIEGRRDRFPSVYQDKDSTSLAMMLNTSINCAIAIAKRNYKLIVPQYRPQLDKLQLLMPIYLGGSFTKRPDFALVLDLEDGIYTPETILPLDAAYQNARLIAKPDDFWLNPDDI
jgi:hypothetical protein